LTSSEFLSRSGKARERAGLTQKALAKKIGTTRSAVCRYERHPTNFTLSTLEKVARAVGRKLVVKLGLTGT